MCIRDRPTAALALALAGCGTPNGPAAGPAATTATTATTLSTSTVGATASMAQGRYVSLAEYRSRPADFATGKTVLFFAAPWCPDCVATDKALMNAGVPAGLTVVKVDYDLSLIHI